MAKRKTASSEDLAYVSARVVEWAVAQSDLSRETLAKQIKVSPEQLAAWERGDSYPRFDKARELAKALRIPFGYLFLSNPPKRDLPLPDRRTLGPSYKPSANFRQVLNDVLVKRDWYRLHVQDTGGKGLLYVGSASLDDSPVTVADSIRRTLDLDESLRRKAHNWSGYLTLLASRAEQAGVLVMRSGVVGNNTQRPIAREEVQGFAVADPLAPIVFVNTSDFVAARIFTLAHELAHIWIGESAILNPEQGDQGNDAIEAFCNSVATEVLVPSAEFLAAWRSTAADRRVATLVRRFWVSARVIVRRARELGELSLPHYRELREQAIAAEKDASDAAGGGNYYRNAAVRSSHRFTEAVVSELARGRLLISEASRLLDMNAHTVVTFAGLTR